MLLKEITSSPEIQGHSRASTVFDIVFEIPTKPDFMKMLEMC